MRLRVPAICTRLLLARSDCSRTHPLVVGRPLHQLAEALVKRKPRGRIPLCWTIRAPSSRITPSEVQRHDVVVFQVRDPNELTFPFRGASRFKDLESADEVTADPASVRTAYLRELASLTLRYDRELRGSGIDYVQLDTSQSLDFALLAYLAARARRK